MCANCVSRADVIVGTVAFGAYVFKEPIRDGLVALGVLPEPHPLAADMRTVTFLRGLDLDPVPVLGDDVVVAADRALAFPRPKVYRRSLGEALAFFTGRSIRSQSKLAVQYTE